jgi:hypothetical protein
MATWKVLGAQQIFTFHANNSMSALNKIRKWGRRRELKYGDDYTIELVSKIDEEGENLHNEYLE